LASDELTRRAIKELNESIDKGTLQAKESSDRTEKFTIAMFLLAIVQLLVAIFQFIYTFAYTDNTQGKVFGIIMIVVTAVVFVYFSWKVFKIEK
jgi:heme/copper-type cytochrome/quinol oxidase subunit 4